jgi:hypothetical protein
MIKKEEVARMVKWGDLNVPHKGWTRIDIVDLEGWNYEICEMYEAREIRFVHIMKHPRYPGALRCGCVCAGHLEANYKAARDRERGLKQAAGKRQRASERLQGVSQRLQQQAPIVARAQRCFAAAQRIAARPPSAWGHQFATGMIAEIQRDYRYASRLSGKQQMKLVELLTEHRAL